MKMLSNFLVTRKIKQIVLIVVVVVIAASISRETLNLHSLFIKRLLIIYDIEPHGRICQYSERD